MLEPDSKDPCANEFTLCRIKEEVVKAFNNR